jgi:hypothetical protein
MVAFWRTPSKWQLLAREYMYIGKYHSPWGKEKTLADVICTGKYEKGEQKKEENAKEKGGKTNVS